MEKTLTYGELFSKREVTTKNSFKAQCAGFVRSEKHPGQEESVFANYLLIDYYSIGQVEA